MNASELPGPARLAATGPVERRVRPYGLLSAIWTRTINSSAPDLCERIEGCYNLERNEISFPSLLGLISYAMHNNNNNNNNTRDWC